MRPFAALLIPLLSYGQTYLGASGAETAAAVAVDPSGNIIVAGTTDSGDFPVSANAFQRSFGSASIAGFIARYDRTASTLLYATYLTGRADTAITAMAVDSAGNIVVAGITATPGSFPATAGAYQNSAGTGFVAKLSAAGDRLLFASTFTAAPSALALDSAGNIYVTGAAPVDFQTTSGVIQTGNQGATDAFVLKLSPDGARAIYATLLGGSSRDEGRAIAVDTAGQVYVAGDTASSNFPLTPGAAQTQFGGQIRYFPSLYGDAFIAKLDPAGARLIYSTFFGGALADVAYGITADRDGNAYVAGGTQSTNFPVTAGAFQQRYAGSTNEEPDPAGDAFAARFGPQGTLVWSTYLGGQARDSAVAVALDPLGNVYLAGTTESGDFPKVAAQTDCHRGGRPFVSHLDAGGGRLLRSTSIAGIGFDQGNAMFLDGASVILAGDTSSRVFFANPSSAQKTFGGGDADAFVTRADVLSPTSPYVACVLHSASYQAGNTGFFPDGAVAPGEIVSIFGGNFSNAVVEFDGVPAPVLYTSASQINVVVPYGVRGPSTAITARIGLLANGPWIVPVADAIPGIFTLDASGTGQAAVINQDGTINSVANPTPRGSTITFYAAGAGTMSPAVADGTILPVVLPLPIPVLPVSVTIRGAAARVTYAGAAPGYISGLLQVNVEVPSSIDLGNSVPLLLRVGNFSSQLNVTIAVR